MKKKQTFLNKKARQDILPGFLHALTTCSVCTKLCIIENDNLSRASRTGFNGGHGELWRGREGWRSNWASRELGSGLFGIGGRLRGDLVNLAKALCDLTDAFRLLYAGGCNFSRQV